MKKINVKAEINIEVELENFGAAGWVANVKGIKDIVASGGTAEYCLESLKEKLKVNLYFGVSKEIETHLTFEEIK